MRRIAGLQRMGAVCLIVIGLLSWTVIALASQGKAVWPEAGGKDVKSADGLTVDATHAADGYILAKGPVTDKRLKLRISMGEVTLTYDLNSNGEYEVFPLQLGNGTYHCDLYKNASGNKYSKAGSVSVKASMQDEHAAFLVPNQYVNYTPETAAVQLSEEICAGLESDQEKFEAIRAYIKSGYVYDFVKAVTVKSGTMPDIDGCMESKMGICQDLAALAACMLRVQGIPTKFIVGYAGQSYHAWNGVFIGGEEVFYDPTLELNGIAGNQTYTVERFY